MNLLKKSSLINTSNELFFNRTASYGVTVNREIFTRLDDLIFNNLFYLGKK